MHAVEDSSKETVCGLDLASLYDYPDIAWSSARPVRCLLCRRWVEVDTGQIK